MAVWIWILIVIVIILVIVLAKKKGGAVGMPKTTLPQNEKPDEGVNESPQEKPGETKDEFRNQ